VTELGAERKVLVAALTFSILYVLLKTPGRAW
jgi:hypothetical protein